MATITEIVPPFTAVPDIADPTNFEAKGNIFLNEINARYLSGNIQVSQMNAVREEVNTFQTNISEYNDTTLANKNLALQYQEASELAYNNTYNLVTNLVVPIDATWTYTEADARFLQKNTPITAGTGTKVTYDEKGLVVSSATLVDTDIPNLNVSKLTAGILAVTRGGTGVGTSTGTGNNVLSNSPTFTTPNIGNATGSINGNASTADTLVGLTSTVAELNKLDGVTTTTAQFNYINSLTSNAQTQLNSKAPTASPVFTGTPSAPTATGATNTTQIATTAQVHTAITADVGVANSAVVKTALNASGIAPIYACRAWVNFNGTGTVAIRASGNVSSITDNGTGDYTVNFATAMPDVNYVMSGSKTYTSNYNIPGTAGNDIMIGAKTVSSQRIYVGGVSGGTNTIWAGVDVIEANLSFCR